MAMSKWRYDKVYDVKKLVLHYTGCIKRQCIASFTDKDIYLRACAFV